MPIATKLSTSSQEAKVRLVGESVVVVVALGVTGQPDGLQQQNRREELLYAEHVDWLVAK